MVNVGVGVRVKFFNDSTGLVIITPQQICQRTSKESADRRLKTRATGRGWFYFRVFKARTSKGLFSALSVCLTVFVEREAFFVRVYEIPTITPQPPGRDQLVPAGPF